VCPRKNAGYLRLALPGPEVRHEIVKLLSIPVVLHSEN
jgi:hypothetical protein